MVSTSSSELSEDSIPSSSAISWEMAHMGQYNDVLKAHTPVGSPCSNFSLNLTFRFVLSERPVYVFKIRK